MTRILRIVGLLAVTGLLCACTPEHPTGRVDRVENEIAEVSFMGAHEDRRCSKGCRYTFVPDTWYIRFCDVKKPAECVVKWVTHAPWGWQAPGQRVILLWVEYEGSPGNRWWKIEGYQAPDTKQDLVL